MKKVFALLLAAILVISMAACGQSAESPDTTPSTEPTEPAAMGTLYVTVGAKLELTYDAEGNALSLTGINEVGKTLAAAKQDQLGKGCVFVLRAVFRYASDNKLLGDARSMVIRVGADDKLPSQDFLEVIATDCQYLADEECTGVQMMIAAGDKLDENGNLTYNTAKALAVRFLDTIEEDITGEDVPENGVYTFSCGDVVATVDAFTGLVTMK